MNKASIFIATTAAIAIAGATIASKTARKMAPNVYYCNTAVSPNVCALPATPYSTVPEGAPVTPPFQPYVGTIGAICNSSFCRPYKQPVYVNL